MPTAIAVTSPDLALPAPESSTWLERGGAALDRQTPAAVVLGSPDRTSLDDALAETSAVLEHHGHLVVLYSTACPPEHVRRLHTLRAVLESDRIAILPSALPPLGVAVLARQLRQLSVCGFSPGVLACAARLLAHYVHAGALLGSVTGLDRVEVDLRSHMKSWLPGAHFAVLATPQPQLLHLDRHSTHAGLRPPGFATQLAVARGQLTADWVTSALAPAWQVQGVYEAHLPTESARWWGTQKLIEFVAAIPDPALLSRLVASVRREECGWCGAEVIGDRCAFCAAPLARDRSRGGSSGREPAAIAGAPAPAPASAEGAGAASDASAGSDVPDAHPASDAPAGSDAPDVCDRSGPSDSSGPTDRSDPSDPSDPSDSSGSPLRQRGLSPVAPSGVPGGPGGPGAPGVLGITGVPDRADAPRVTGAPQTTGTPPVTGVPHALGVPGTPGAPGAPGASGASGIPGIPGLRGAPTGLGGPGQPDVRGPAFTPGGVPRPAGPPPTGPRVLPGHPDFPGHPDLCPRPGAARTATPVR
ncbi:collagen-like protein [Streptomyces sp. NPDC057555]|uniref:collagen-like triple helix repeat-containing protein n=1 Tax=Streptomyces sp. NPDC057555 TaxID=3346166 RepID=UPI00368FCB29